MFKMTTKYLYVVFSIKQKDVCKMSFNFVEKTF